MPVKFRLYGYAHDTSLKQITINESQAQWVRKMFEWCAAERVSAWTIARRLAAADAPSPTGRGWYKESVVRLLRNEAFTGTAYANKWDSRNHNTVRPRDEWIPITIPAIVSQSLWAAAQLTLEHNRAQVRKHASHDALLRGLLKCGYCGHAMRTYISRDANRIPRYYCSPTARFQPGDPGKAEARKQCKGSSVRMYLIDSLVWHWMGEFLENPEAVLSFSQVEASETQALEEEISVLEGALARCSETKHGVLSFYRSRLITKAEADLQLADIRKDEIAFERRLREVRTIVQAKPLPEDALARVHAIKGALADTLSIQQKNQILHELVDHIEVWSNSDFSQPPQVKVHLRVGSLVAASLIHT